MSKLQNKVEDISVPEPFFTQPVVGTTLTALSGVAFLFVCMILPLVGKAGSVTVHAHKNAAAFAGVLVVTLALALLATVSKLKRRHIDQSPLPYFSLILVALSGLLLVALASGLLSI